MRSKQQTNKWVDIFGILSLVMLIIGFCIYANIRFNEDFYYKFQVFTMKHEIREQCMLEMKTREDYKLIWMYYNFKYLKNDEKKQSKIDAE